jgi:hypothetical protein
MERSFVVQDSFQNKNSSNKQHYDDEDEDEDEDQSIAWEALAIKEPREVNNKGHKNREITDALSKGSALHASISTIKTQQTTMSLDVNHGQQKSPDPRITTQRRKTIDNTVTNTTTTTAASTTKGAKVKPRRMKSHDPGETKVKRVDPFNNNATTKGNNTSAFHMSVSTMQTQQTSISLDVNRGRSRSPETRKKLAAQRRKTIDNTVSRPNTTAAKVVTTTTKAEKAKPRRMKSHGPGSGEEDNKPMDNNNSSKNNNAKTIRRTKSDPDPGGPKRTRTPSRRPPPKELTEKQRADSTNTANNNNNNNNNNNATIVSNNMNNSKARRRRLTTTSDNGMDRSAQSVPSNNESRVRRVSTESKSLHTRIKYNETSSKPSVASAKKRVVKGADTKGIQKPGVKRANAPSEATVMSEDDDIRSLSTSLDGGSLLSGHIAKDSQGRNNLAGVLDAERKRKGDPISPFSTRADSVDEFARDDDDVYSKSEASSINSTATSSVTKSSTTRRESLSKQNNRGVRGSQHNAINAYFSRGNQSGTDDENDAFAIKAGESVSESLAAGSLLSDYSTNSAGTRRRPLASDMSFDTTKTGSAAPKVISPFSFHASKSESDHTTPTLTVGTEHTSSPLIPDSDDEDEFNSSFHLDVPGPISSTVGDAPLTPVAEPKKSVPVVVKEEAKKPAPAKKDEPIAKKEAKKMDAPITGPVSIKGPVLNNAKKEKGKETAKPIPQLDDLDFDDPIPRQVTIPAHPKPSFWEALCCRSTAAVAS